MDGPRERVTQDGSKAKDGGRYLPALRACVSFCVTNPTGPAQFRPRRMTRGGDDALCPASSLLPDMRKAATSFIGLHCSKRQNVDAPRVLQTLML